MSLKSFKYNYGSQSYETIQMISYHLDASLTKIEVCISMPPTFPNRNHTSCEPKTRIYHYIRNKYLVIHIVI